MGIPVSVGSRSAPMGPHYNAHFRRLIRVLNQTKKGSHFGAKPHADGAFVTHDPERTRRNRSADGSDAANPRRSAAPNPIRRRTRDRKTAHMESEGTPRESAAAPTAVVRGQRHRPSPALHCLLTACNTAPKEVRNSSSCR